MEQVSVTAPQVQSLAASSGKNNSEDQQKVGIFPKIVWRMIARHLPGNDYFLNTVLSLLVNLDQYTYDTIVDALLLELEHYPREHEIQTLIDTYFGKSVETHQEAVLIKMRNAFRAFAQKYQLDVSNIAQTRYNLVQQGLLRGMIGRIQNEYEFKSRQNNSMTVHYLKSGLDEKLNQYSAFRHAISPYVTSEYGAKWVGNHAEKMLLYNIVPCTVMFLSITLVVYGVKDIDVRLAIPMLPTLPIFISVASACSTLFIDLFADKTPHALGALGIALISSFVVSHVLRAVMPKQIEACQYIQGFKKTKKAYEEDLAKLNRLKDVYRTEKLIKRPKQNMYLSQLPEDIRKEILGYYTY